MHAKSTDMFQDVLLVSAFIAIFVVFAACYFAKKNGIDIRDKKFIFRLSFVCIIIFVCLPIWFADLPVQLKAVMTAIGLIVGIGNVFATGKFQETLRRVFRK